MALVAMVMVSCGGGVNRSDPKSVADAALECFDKGDFVGMKALVNPADSRLVKQMDKIIERSQAYREKNGDVELTPKSRTFKSAKEEFTNREITSQSPSAIVSYDGDWPTRVRLVQVDGQWYYDNFK